MSARNRRRHPPTEREIIRGSIVPVTIDGVTMPAAQHSAVNVILAADFGAVGDQVCADAWDFDTRIAPEDIERGLKSLRELYMLLALDPWNVHVVLHPLDVFYRAHLAVDTQEYYRFWLSVGGRSCIAHRQSIDLSDQNAVASALGLYAVTRCLIGCYFKDADPTFHPEMATKADLRCIIPPLNSLPLKATTGLMRKGSLFH